MLGQSIAHYKISDELGAGGMGVVYRARDTRLDRDVAVKALTPEFADDPARLARFETEARTLASLQHPHIGAIFGLERLDGASFLILELVEGETLADRIKAGPLPLDEALRLARQIAEALAAAHDAGIVHRDLKPANIKIDPSGQVKVLDFGLAKTAGPDAAQTDAATDSTTETDYATAIGTILGTAPYMSPEQARGQEVDERTDVWAFGCVLFEMLSGHRTFAGPTRSDVTAAVLRAEPDWEDLPEEVPQSLRRLLLWCLAKEPGHRLRSMADVALMMPSISDDAGADAPADRESTPRRPPWLLPAIGIAAAALGALGGYFADILFERPPSAEPVQIPMAPPNGLKPSLGFGPSLAVSSSGRYLAFVLETGTTTTLYVKGPDNLEAVPVAGTRGARTPFFSPRDEWVGFFDEGDRRLKKVSLGGGEPVAIAAADGASGAVWSPDGSILFATTRGGIVRVDAEDGDVEQLFPTGEWPQVAAGGEVVFFTLRDGRGSFDEARIAAISRAGGEPTIVLENAYYPHYAQSGHLIFVQGHSVLAAPFDIETLQITGPAKTVLERVWTSSWTGYADFAFSDTGTLLYLSGGPDAGRARVVSVDRSGASTPLLTERRPYRVPRFARDGQHVALTLADEQVDIWTYDLRRKSFSRMTDSASWDGYPQWQPGTDAIAFASMREGLAAIFLKDLRSETVRRLFDSEHANYPSSWSPDGRLLAYTEDHPETGNDVRVYSLDSGSSSAFVVTPHVESTPEFSPDGRYIAYESNEGGQQSEIYVRPYPAGSPKLKISTAGGRFPRWGAGGRELFYWVGGRLMAVSLEFSPDPEAAPPRLLFEGPYGPAFDVSDDGQSFLMLEEMAPSDPPMRFNFVAGWFERLKLLAPAAG